MGKARDEHSGEEVVAYVDNEPLARLFDAYEKQGLIPTHIDLERCQSNTSPSLFFLFFFFWEDAYTVFMVFQ